jgi:proton glutamate symport protein
MVAKQFATVGAGQLLAMVKFTIGFVAASLLTWIISILVIWLSSGARFGQTLAAARQPVMVAIATRSSIACIPTSISALVDALGYDRTRIELMIPLGVTLLRFGPTLYYAFSTVFVTQLYDTPTSLLLYATIVVGSLLTGLASAGTTGVLTISLLGLIFQPLNLPLEAALALLITIDPVIDIFRTVTIVLPNCAVAAFLYRDERGAAHADPLSVEDATHDAIGLPTAAPEPAE